MIRKCAIGQAKYTARAKLMLRVVSYGDDIRATQGGDEIACRPTIIRMVEGPSRWKGYTREDASVAFGKSASYRKIRISLAWVLSMPLDLKWRDT